MSRINEYTPLKRTLLTTLESETNNLDRSVELISNRLENVDTGIDQLDQGINVLKNKLDNISQLVNDEDYQAQVVADTLQVKLRKSIIAIIDENNNTQPDLTVNYSELLDPTSEYYGFSEGSAWFILES